MNRVAIVSCLGLFLAATQALAVDEYRLDDGVGEQNIGVTGGGANKATAWLNRFVIEPGKDTITEISVAFGDIPMNTLVEVILWGDFNNDGNPIDAFVLSATPGMITNPNVLSTHNVFQTFDIPDVTMPIGAVFYAGAVVQNYAQGKEPARIDKDGTDSIPVYLPNNHSFIASQTSAGFASVDPNNMASAQLPIVPVATALGSDGTWLIRVNAVPEPATAGLMLLMGAAVLRHRAR
ncbi:MAG: PEP-CTERM sorting domain-containing protein [Phycisphaerales bacterium]